ncbi:MAG: hypothetical protein JSR45_05870 [Proteobacteria bacterium]|nr:hypothetical protein [Pseudomonadota bacterium]
MERIYVQIPAYRDSELSATLIDLYAKAEAPERVRTAVLWQYGEGETLARKVQRLPNLDIVAVPSGGSQGCNWARSLLQQRWAGEAYTLLLDSHHRFVRGWDRLLVDMHRGLEEAGVAKPMLTAYLPAYDPLITLPYRSSQPFKIYPLQREQGMLLRLTSCPIPYWKTLAGPIEADFASLHFIFARGALNQELRFDPDIYFFGDEVLIGARAFTSGYDMYHPHRVVGWHCYNRNSRVPHWDDHPDWHLRHRKALERIRRLLSGETSGDFGLGSARSLQAYEDRLLAPLVLEAA